LIVYAVPSASAPRAEFHEQTGRALDTVDVAASSRSPEFVHARPRRRCGFGVVHRLAEEAGDIRARRGVVDNGSVELD
ncbi:hypothetical protein, partial [Corynebacterium variabile]|uniref:hypothetical protein n=1 Tax=Corynebacterium variabile TaxID=1727 RepID=UPI003FD35AC1